MAADPRQFTEHNSVGGVNVYYEDKRMEELKSATAKTASQISTADEYIPLQDTDGNLVKINPASFQEAVRNVLGSLLANNDKGTTISGIPALSGSGASLDFGSVTPANLASVLGATVNVGYVTDILAETLSAYYGRRIVIGMTDNSNATGVPVPTLGTYGIFAYLPCYFSGESRFNIILYALFGQDLQFSRFFIKSSWGGEGVWKEVTLK